MDKDKEASLLSSFPEFFYKDDDGSPSFYFECGSGWYQILNNLFLKIKSLGSDGIIITQIKEKFGGLRVYYSCISGDDGYFNKIDALIQEAEHEANHTCEECGKPGKLITKGWMRTLCDICEGEKT